VEIVLHVSHVLPLIGQLERDNQYTPRNLSFVSLKFPSYWATWKWHSVYSVEFVLHVSQIPPLIGQLESDIQYTPWNLSFVSLKFLLLLGNLKVTFNILRGICPSCLSNFSSYWATLKWHSIYSVEFVLHVSQISPLIGQLESDSQYTPWIFSRCHSFHMFQIF